MNEEYQKSYQENVLSISQYTLVSKELVFEQIEKIAQTYTQDRLELSTMLLTFFRACDHIQEHPIVTLFEHAYSISFYTTSEKMRVIIETKDIMAVKEIEGMVTAREGGWYDI